MLTIQVDADACPVKSEVYRVALRYGLEVNLVSNSYLSVPDRGRVRLVVVKNDFSTVATHRFELGGWCVRRHHHGAWHAHFTRRPGDCLRMVAGRHRNQPAVALAGFQGQDAVERPARLERSGLLQTLALEAETNADPLTERA